MEGGTLVLEQRRRLVHQRAGEPLGQPPEGLLLHHRLAEAHVDRALDLAHHQDRVDRAADVVGDPHVLRAIEAGRGVDLDLDHASGVGVGRRWTDAGALEAAGRARRGVGADGSQRAEHRLGGDAGVGEIDAAIGILGVEDAPLGEDQALRGDLEALRHRPGEQVARPLGGLDGRVAHHQRHARRVAAEIDRRQVGVADAQPDVGQVDAQRLGDHGGEHRVRALADLRFAAVDGDPARTVEQQLDSRLRHVVPVDRQAGAAQVGAAGEAQPAALGQLAVALAPATAVDHRFDALAQPDRADLEPVGGHGLGVLEVLETQIGRVDAEPVRGLVEVDLPGESRLRRAVPALRTARRLVGVRANAVEAVVGELVGDGLQRPGVVGRGDAVAAVSAAVEGGLQVLPGDGAVVLETRLEPHLHRMAPAVTVEDLFPAQGDLHRAAELERHLGDHDLVVEGIALAAEAAAVRTGDHADSGGRDVEHLGQRAMDVVRRLGRGVDRHPVDVLGNRDGRVLLHGDVGVALVEGVVLEHQIRFGEGAFDVAELERRQLVHVAAGPAVVVNAGLGRGERLRDRGDGLQRLVVDLHRQGRFAGGVFGHRGDRRHRVAHHSNLVGAEGMLVLGDRQDAEGVGHRCAGQEAEHAGHPRRLGGVDSGDAGVRHGRAHQLEVAEAREGEVVGEAGDPGDLGPAVDAAKRLADPLPLPLGPFGRLVARLANRFSHRRRPPPPDRSRHRRGSRREPPRLAAIPRRAGAPRRRPPPRGS